MKILVIGGGGREHALAWVLAGDSRQPELFCAPGNAGTAALGTNLDIAATDVDALVDWAREDRPDLTVVGPEAPLCLGVVDRFATEGLRAFGPRRDAAQLEGSKSFAKDIMRSAGVPTAWAKTFTDPDDAKRCVRERGAPIVIKADGLAAGKGVAVCESVEDAEEALDAALGQRRFGDAGASVLVEEFMAGEEASILALVDGKSMILLPSSQDHKRAFDGDNGPNTGGMGAYSPAPVITPALWPDIRDTVLQPTIDELNRRGISFKGVLYAGLMITESGPKVVEYNVRFGDPEAQCVLPRLKGDLIPVLEACIDGTVRDDMLESIDNACVCVVMAAGGYPGAYAKGSPIHGLDEANAIDRVRVFHAGTRIDGGQAVTAGGRVLGVTASGADLDEALNRAYAGVERITFAGAQYRADIGSRARAGSPR